MFSAVFCVRHSPGARAHSVLTLHLHRDIYYTESQLFKNQAAVDSIIDDISCMLKVPRRSLHVVSHSKYKTLPQNRSPRAKSAEADRSAEATQWNLGGGQVSLPFLCCLILNFLNITLICFNVSLWSNDTKQGPYQIFLFPKYPYMFSPSSLPRFWSKLKYKYLNRWARGEAWNNKYISGRFQICSFSQLSTSKGLIAGNLRYVEEDGTQVQCMCSATVSISPPYLLRGTRPSVLNCISFLGFCV